KAPPAAAAGGGRRERGSGGGAARADRGREGRAAAPLPREAQPRGLRKIPAVTPRRLAAPSRWAARLALLGVVLAGSPPAAHAATAPRDVRAADALAAAGPGKDRDRALAAWAAHAPLAELVFVLRRPASVLGSAEGDLVAQALERAPEGRADLRRRLA